MPSLSYNMENVPRFINECMKNAVLQSCYVVSEHVQHTFLWQYLLVICCHAMKRSYNMLSAFVISLSRRYMKALTVVVDNKLRIKVEHQSSPLEKR